MSDPNVRTYLDYNATAPIMPEVVLAISDALCQLGNPSSVHHHGRTIRALIEDARESLGVMLRCRAEQITFTSGATEANAAAIYGMKTAGLAVRVLCSTVEHPSVLDHVSCDDRLPVDSAGVIRLDVLNDRMKSTHGPVLACIMMANNETGVVQPIRDVCDIVHRHQGYVLCDAVQAVGKMPIDPAHMDIDLMTFSGHKLGGPPGIGALVNCRGLDLEPFLIGGGQEKRMRSGTENAPAIIGLGAAAKAIQSLSPSDAIAALRDRFEVLLREVRPEAVIHGLNAPRIPNTTNVSLPETLSERQVIGLDLAGFSVSAGSACSSGKIGRSHVLEAMGVSPRLSESAIRVSIGSNTNWEDLENFVDAWSAL